MTILMVIINLTKFRKKSFKNYALNRILFFDKIDEIIRVENFSYLHK